MRAGDRLPVTVRQNSRSTIDIEVRARRAAARPETSAVFPSNRPSSDGHWSGRAWASNPSSKAIDPQGPARIRNREINRLGGDEKIEVVPRSQRSRALGREGVEILQFRQPISRPHRDVALVHSDCRVLDSLHEHIAFARDTQARSVQDRVAGMGEPPAVAGVVRPRPSRVPSRCRAWRSPAIGRSGNRTNLMYALRHTEASAMREECVARATNRLRHRSSAITHTR